jgi:hypothetical protein
VKVKERVRPHSNTGEIEYLQAKEKLDNARLGPTTLLSSSERDGG